MKSHRALNISGLRRWPFGITWRHRLRYHWTRHNVVHWFPICGFLL